MFKFCHTFDIIWHELVTTVNYNWCQQELTTAVSPTTFNRCWSPYIYNFIFTIILQFLYHLMLQLIINNIFSMLCCLLIVVVKNARLTIMSSKNKVMSILPSSWSSLRLKFRLMQNQILMKLPFMWNPSLVDYDVSKLGDNEVDIYVFLFH